MTSTIFRSGAEKVCDSAHGRTGNSNDDNELQPDAGTPDIPIYLLDMLGAPFSMSNRGTTEAVCEHVWGAWTYSGEQPDGLYKLYRRCYCVVPHPDGPAEEIL